MGKRINRLESVQKGKLVYRLNLWQKIGFIIEIFFFYVLLPALFFFVIIDPKSKSGIVSYLIWLIMAIYMIYAYDANYKLHVIEFKDIEKDRKLLVEILQYELPKFEINDNGINMIVSKQQIGYFHWGKILTVIFHDSKAYINIVTLGKGESISLFHPIANHLKIRQIKKSFYLWQNGS